MKYMVIDICLGIWYYYYFYFVYYEWKCKQLFINCYVGSKFVHNCYLFLFVLFNLQRCKCDNVNLWIFMRWVLLNCKKMYRKCNKKYVIAIVSFLAFRAVCIFINFHDESQSNALEVTKTSSCSISQDIMHSRIKNTCRKLTKGYRQVIIFSIIIADLTTFNFIDM